MITDFTFGYGSNMNWSDLRSWLERNGFDSSLIKNRWPAVLQGYDFVWNFHSNARAGGVANIEPKSGAVIAGALIEFDASLLKAFDLREGHPHFYSRGKERIPVVREDNESIPAWIYVAGPNRGGRRDIRPTREYRDIVLEGARELDLTTDHQNKIAAWEVLT